MAQAVGLAPDAIYLPTRHGVYSPYAAKVRSILEQLLAGGSDREHRRVLRRLSRLREALRGAAGPRRRRHRRAYRVADAGHGTERARPAVERRHRRHEDHRQDRQRDGQAGRSAVGSHRRGGGVRTTLARAQVPGNRPGDRGTHGSRRHPDRRRSFSGSHRADSARGSPRPHGPYDGRSTRPAPLDWAATGRPFWSTTPTTRPLAASPTSARSQTTSGIPTPSKNRYSPSASVSVGETRKRSIRARTVTLKLRYSDFKTLTRSKTLDQPTNDERQIHACVLELLEKAWARKLPIRLVGVALSNLEGQFSTALPTVRRGRTRFSRHRDRRGPLALRIRRDPLGHHRNQQVARAPGHHPGRI